MSRTLLIPSSVRPSYSQGFARSSAESAYPGLWPDNAWPTALGPTGTTVRDIAGQYDAVMVNGEASDWSQSRIGPVITLDGSDEYLNAGDIPDTNAVSKLSVGIWYKPAATETNNGLVSRWNNAVGSEWNWYVRLGTGSVVQANTKNGQNVAGTTAITNTAHWYHIQWVFDGKNEALIYVDGVLDGSASITQDVVGSAQDHNVWIGAYYSSSFGMNGQIGPCYMHRRVLQPSEIRQLYRDPLAPFRRRQFLPTYSPAEEAGGWQPYWAPRLAQFVGSGLK